MLFDLERRSCTRDPWGQAFECHLSGQVTCPLVLQWRHSTDSVGGNARHLDCDATLAQEPLTNDHKGLHSTAEGQVLLLLLLCVMQRRLLLHQIS